MTDYSNYNRGSLNNPNSRISKGGKKIDNDVTNPETPLSDKAKEKLAKQPVSKSEAASSKADLRTDMDLLAWIAKRENPDLNPSTARITREVLYNLPSPEKVNSVLTLVRETAQKELKELKVDPEQFVATYAPHCASFDEYIQELADDLLIGKPVIKL